MTLTEALYTLAIGPIELLFGTIFSIIYRFCYSPGITIIFLSIFVNLLVLPLYRRADAMQKEEHEKEAKLKPWIDHINKTFDGDERFMMLQAYYRENHYKPTDTLKGSVSLLLEIPFFMAAYRYLSRLVMLQERPFGPILDLGAPDGLLKIGGIAVNVLPILMTLINFISAAIYLKGYPLKNKIQTYGLAIIFLVLLYQSPSGLVLYWTCNNIFSLLKNIVNQTKNPKKVLSISAFALGTIMLVFVLIKQPFDSWLKRIFLIVVCLLMQMPVWLKILFRKGITLPEMQESKTDDQLFYLSAAFMAVLTGSLICTEVIKSATLDFVNVANVYSPLWYVLKTLLYGIGTFVIWFGIYYKLMSGFSRIIMSLALWIISGCSIVNYMFFGMERGNLSTELVFDKFPTDSLKECLINLLVLLAVSCVLFIVWKTKRTFAKGIMLTLGISACVMSLVNVQAIAKSINEFTASIGDKEELIPNITLSKTGKNVIILMMDRSLGYFIPFMIEEKPELIEKFAGFTYYPQMLSFANKTNEGLPGIYGGYEYTPENINKRDDIPLMEKHNEALLMMPRLFHDAGYEVSVLDPSYANYKWIPDVSIYRQYPGIFAYNVNGYFSSPEVFERTNEARKRNFFCYSIYKISPLIAQPTLYTEGMYNDVDTMTYNKMAIQYLEDLLTAKGINGYFESTYNVLLNLPSLTKAVEEPVNTYTTLDNQATHEPTLLQMPDYTLSPFVYNSEYDSIPITRTSGDGRELILDTKDRILAYHVNMGSFLMLGEWMDYLREIGVYDNTRIIIVSDHGTELNYPEFKFGEQYNEEILAYNSVLMVKDFDSDVFTIDEQFMTTADVPTIAMEGLILDPVNPATGTPITNEEKFSFEHKMQAVDDWDTNENNGNTFIPSKWFSYQGDDIYDKENWTYIGIY